MIKQPLESKIQADILKYLKSVPQLLAFKVPAGPYSSTGISDIIGCYRGRFFALEVKRHGNTPTPRQCLFLDNVCVSDGVGRVVHDVETVREIIAGIERYNQ